MKKSVKKAVGASALGALSIVEMLHLQQASATPVTFTGSVVANPKGGSVQVAITVDGVSGVYRMTNISTPLQPTGQNGAYANLAIPTLISEALAAQSAAISGYSGASEISAAWKSSLSSAIAQAAAAGEALGTSSAPSTPAPQPSSNPTSVGGTTPVAVNTPSTVIPTSVAVAPTYYPLNLPPCGVSNGGGLSSYFSAVSSAISQISSASGDNRTRAIANAQAALSRLQSVAGQPSGNCDVGNLNTQMSFVMSQGNQAMTDYYAKVVAAANKLYVNAQASAAAIEASPAPTVTVTVTAKPSGPAIVVAPGSVIKKTFTCIRNIGGVTTKKTVKAFIVKCPLGFKLLKK